MGHHGSRVKTPTLVLTLKLGTAPSFLAKIDAPSFHHFPVGIPTYPQFPFISLPFPPHSPPFPPILFEVGCISGMLLGALRANPSMCF